uniref:Uncharacterized protein n=1 Tax=Romanomermis culicivorax TaxID=13658 RepID=A0A915KRA0_ROMCU
MISRGSTSDKSASFSLNSSSSFSNDTGPYPDELICAKSSRAAALRPGDFSSFEVPKPKPKYLNVFTFWRPLKPDTQTYDDRFDVFAHITRLRQGCTITDGEWYIQTLGYGLGKY